MYNFKFTFKTVTGNTISKEFTWKRMTKYRFYSLLELLRTCYEATLEETTTDGIFVLNGNPQTSAYTLDNFLESLREFKRYMD